MRKDQRNVNSQSKERLPVRVPFTAVPAGETPPIGRWAHRVVWTDRMLETLVKDQVKGGRWHRNQRWPNANFTNLGFASLREAHCRFAQSHTGNY